MTDIKFTKGDAVKVTHEQFTDELVKEGWKCEAKNAAPKAKKGKKAAVDAEPVDAPEGETDA